MLASNSGKEMDMTIENICGECMFSGDCCNIDGSCQEQKICEDCQRDRDRCCDCFEGDLYLSPDWFEITHLMLINR